MKETIDPKKLIFFQPPGIKPPAVPRPSFYLPVSVLLRSRQDTSCHQKPTKTMGLSPQHSGTNRRTWRLKGRKVPREGSKAL